MKRATTLGWLKHDVTNRGVTAWLLSGLFFAFYVLLYFGHNVASFYTTKSVNGQNVLIRNGWPLFHNVLFSALFVGILAGGVHLYLQRKKELEQSHNPILVYTGASLLLTASMYFLPDVYHQLGFKGQPFTDFAKSLGLPGKWMLYGLIYTICITTGGLYVIWKYRHNRYQVIRTSVVIFVQATFGFSVPWIMKIIKMPDYYFSYIWPLKIDYFYPSTIAYQMKAGLPVPIIVYSFVAGLILTPIMAIFFGKRWYCSWVCGCGGLSNTFGEPWRHLSNKSKTSWNIEKVTIYSVLGLSILVTLLAWLAGQMPDNAFVKGLNKDIRDFYSIIIVSLLSGVIGVGLYPVGGTRVWCRFACPMAALLGALQRFGKFHIRVKKDMCISCGMCTKFCEMGIDVRSYAQKNESFTRASCVGCGMCSEVCPRGVLRLENTWDKAPHR